MGTKFGLAIVNLSLQPQIQTVKKTSWFLFFLLFAVSCLDDPDCFLLNNDVLGITFNVMGSSALDSVSFNRLTVNDQVFWENLDTARRVTGISIAGDRIAERSRISFLIEGEEKVLDLSYRVKVQFVSEDCGPRYIYSDLVANEHNFDSVNVVNTTPGRDASSLNIKIYRCPEITTIGLSFFEFTLPATGSASSRALSPKLDAVVTEDGTQLYVGQSLSSVKLPLNLAATRTTYKFDFADDFGEQDSVRDLAIQYVVTPEERYRACGVQNFIDSLRIETVEGHIPFDLASIATESDGDLRDVVTDPAINNVNLYRCPPTNIMQLAFENAAGLARSKLITSVTNDYNADILYEGETVSRIQLPLNTGSNSTTFTIQLGEVTETITVNHPWVDPLPETFPEESACRQRQVVRDLSEATDNPNVTLEETEVLYPAVTNIVLEVAD